MRLAFGARLREVRLSVGISQEELSYRTNLERTYVCGVERGRRNIGLENICRLAHAPGSEREALLVGVPGLLPDPIF